MTNDNIALLRAALGVCRCKTVEDVADVIAWCTDGEYTPEAAKASQDDAKAVHDALLASTRRGSRMDDALRMAREWRQQREAEDEVTAPALDATDEEAIRGFDN